ncbi:Membrane protein involved in the export of O-antigen and teichoic acid [Halogranum amylolyticum]|uniref:Membrane protein involved in the export of O-antigen and teichoic acid n=1 Tax=Halogranum amylolyticum TaxID=660520 RepID=A0A1H8SUN6_9EURY|nr:polysaccharide biosynthesis C-terminal domain-containing protein [Halogranum amylolyticum]SEO82078.1 Membrane protein involved in the export of O-antigen and teichoic acid [Halogranum amylolyticum]
MKETQSLSIGRETLLSVGSKAIMAAVGFGGFLLFANWLGPEVWGDYKTVVAAAFVLVQIPAGVGLALRKRVSEVDSDPSGYLGVGLLVHLGFTALVVAGFVLLRPFAADYFGTLELAAGVVAIGVTLGLFDITNRFYAGIGYPARASWVDGARSVLTFLFQLGFVLLNLSAFGLTIGLASATLLTGVFSAVLAKVTPSMPTVRSAKRVYGFARFSVPNSLLKNLYDSADVLIVQWVAGSTAVGFYSAGAQLAMPAAMFAGSIRDALTVKSSGLSSVGEGVRADLANSVSYAGLIAVPLFFGSLAMPTEIVVTLLSGSFRGAAPALVGLTLYQLFNVYRLPFEATLEGTDRPAVVFRVNVGTVLVHLPLAIVLGLEYQLVGVIASTVVAEALRLVAYQYVARTDYGGVVVTRPIADQLAAGVLMCLVVFGVERTLLPVTGWPLLLVDVGLGAAVYFLTLLAVSPHFRETLRHTLPMLEPVES